MIEVQTNPELGIRFVALSHPGSIEGLNYRTENAYRIDPDSGVALMIDGGERRLGIGISVDNVADEFLKTIAVTYFGSSDDDLKQILRAFDYSREKLDKLYNICEYNHMSSTAVKVRKDYFVKRLALIGHSGITRASLYLPDTGLTTITPHMINGHYYNDTDKMLEVFQPLDRIEGPSDLDKLSFEQRHLFEMRKQPAPDLIMGYTDYRSFDYPLAVGTRLLLTAPGIHLNLTTSEMNNAFTPDSIATVQNLVNMALERSRDQSHIRRYQAPLTALIIEEISL